MRTLFKPVISASLVSFSVGVIYAHGSGRLFPWITLGTLVAILLTTGIALYISSLSSMETYTLLVGLIGLGVLYRIFVFAFPESMVGIDPDNYAIWTQQVLTAGSTSVLDPAIFYRFAPVFLLFIGMTKLIGGMSVVEAPVVFSLAMGILYPLTAVVFVRRLSPSRNVAVVTAGLTAFASLSIQYSYAPVAMTTGLLLWATLLLLVILFLADGRRSILTVVTLVLLLIMFTHKLPLLVIAIVLLSTYFLNRLFKKERTSTVLLRLSLFGFLLALIQWITLTEFINTVINRVLVALTILSVESVPVQYPAAVKPLETVPRILWMRSHGLVLLPIAGAAWLFVLSRYRERNTAQVILAAASVTTVLVAVGIVASTAFNPQRGLVFAELVLPPLVAVFLVNGIRKYRWGRGASCLILTLIVITSLFSLVAVPDYGYTPRYYLTEREVQTKSFGHHYATETIYTDQYAWEETIPARIKKGRPQQGQYKRVGDPLFNGTLDELDRSYVLFRTNVRVYWTPSGLRLTWNPDEELPKSYHVIYDSNGATLYRGS